MKNKPIDVVFGVRECDSHSKKFLSPAARLPRTPYCTDSLEQGIYQTARREALQKKYLQLNPAQWVAFLVFDIDRPMAVLAHEDAPTPLPPPNFAAVNDANGHAHLVYKLADPVLVESLHGVSPRTAPMRRLAFVQRGLRHLLGADPGYSGLIAKNPLHPAWRLVDDKNIGYWRGGAYSLDQLSQYVPDDLKIPSRAAANQEGVGRNVSLFDTLRQQAYTEIRPFWGGRNMAAWERHCLLTAEGLNVTLFGSYRAGENAGPLSYGEVAAVARSVAKWVWTHCTPQGFSDYQRIMGERGNAASQQVRAARSQERAERARELEALGFSRTEIAEKLGFSLRTVQLYLNE